MSTHIHIHLTGKAKDNSYYEESKKVKQELERKSTELGKKLESFPKGAMGLTTPETQKNPEFIKTKQEFERVFAKLREYNSWFTKQFKKEYAAERNARYSQ
jgi:hypothetical protein